MAFSVKATLVGFQGDPDRYPCHAMLNIGDELIFDGAELKGKMCPDVLPQVAEAIVNLQTSGTRYTPPGHYNLFWYSVNSSIDPERAKFDGNGFKPINKEYEEPKFHLRNYMPQGGFKWPPEKERTVAKEVGFLCPDARTAACFICEVFDFATAGYHLPYTRREITIMDRIHRKAGGSCKIDDIIGLYEQWELDDIYPTLVYPMVLGMAEEMEILGFATINDGVVTVTQKGIDRVARYITEIPEEHAKAMGLI